MDVRNIYDFPHTLDLVNSSTARVDSSSDSNSDILSESTALAFRPKKPLQRGIHSYLSSNSYVIFVLDFFLGFVLVSNL